MRRGGIVVSLNPRESVVKWGRRRLLQRSSPPGFVSDFTGSCWGPALEPSTVTPTEESSLQLHLSVDGDRPVSWTEWRSRDARRSDGPAPSVDRVEVILHGITAWPEFPQTQVSVWLCSNMLCRDSSGTLDHTA